LTTGPDAPRDPAADAPERDAAFERDVLACLPDVARFARSLARDPADADDLVQETFLRAYRAYHTFRPGADARRWLFAICRNVFLRQRERAARFVEADGDPELDALAAAVDHASAVRDSHGDALDRLLDRLDVGPAIERAIEELAAPFRLVVVLVDVEGQSYEEAAAVAGVPVGTVRSRLFRARRLLQARLLAHARDAGLGPPRGEGPGPAATTPRAAVPRPTPRR
jgi:RNA polymerase sigma-70 factor (ECF subfamily)